MTLINLLITVFFLFLFSLYFVDTKKKCYMKNQDQWRHFFFNFVYFVNKISHSTIVHYSHYKQVSAKIIQDDGKKFNLKNLSICLFFGFVYIIIDMSTKQDRMVFFTPQQKKKFLIYASNWSAFFQVINKWSFFWGGLRRGKCWK